MASTSYDLIVIGTGFAGCMTALSFLETSRRLPNPGRVALVEAGKKDEHCGASRWTGAFLRLDRNLDFDEDWISEMIQVSNNQADLAYFRKLAQEAKATAEYVQDHGVRFILHEEKDVDMPIRPIIIIIIRLLNHSAADQACSRFCWNSRQTQHFVMPDGGGWAIIQTLMKHIEQFNNNCDVHWEMEARTLLTDHQGRVNGVQARKADGLLENLYASDVMLASGGFEGNREMLAKYVGLGTHELQLIAPGLKYNRGQGLNMALDVGADTAGSFDGIHCEMVDTRATKPDAVIWGHNYGIVVNENCERFYDEGKRHLFATFEMIALELWRDHNNKGFFITDSTIMDRFRPGWVYESTDQEPIRADSTPDLALKLGVDAEKLRKTISEFNQACNDKPFDLMKLDGKATTGLQVNKSNWANPLDRPPYYAFPLIAQLTFTYGGLKVNTNSQVLATNGAPIPGLWASGELTGLYYNGRDTQYPPLQLQ